MATRVTFLLAIGIIKGNSFTAKQIFLGTGEISLIQVDRFDFIVDISSHHDWIIKLILVEYTV